MGIIKKIVIDDFRSIHHIELDCEQTNVFSGLNDCGKSNILRALNLFFNDKVDFLSPLEFDRDYCKIGKALAQRANKKRQLIKIKIYFNIPEGFNSLRGKKIFLEKTYDRNGEVNKIHPDGIKSRDITRLVNRIKYIYIPALKEEKVTQYLLGLIGENKLLQEGEIGGINNTINDKLKNLNFLLKNSHISTKTSIGFPELIKDFWERMNVNTTYDKFEDLQTKIDSTKKGKKIPLKEDDYQIPLSFRGEGVKSMYIPPLLKWLQSKEKNKFYIWGIDEPENSLEFKKAEELANLYFEEYSKETQLFLTSHSLAFIFPNSKVKPQIFRIDNKAEFGQTRITNIEETDKIKDEICEELGLLEIQKEFYEELREKEAQLRLQNKLIEEIEKENKKVMILVEGPTDEKILETAWKKLYPNEESFFCFQNCGGAGPLKSFVLNPFFKKIKSDLKIALWDCDSEGYAQFKGFFKNNPENKFLKISKRKIKHKVENIYGMVLPSIKTRKKYTSFSENPQHQFLSIEHYFSDGILEKYGLIKEKENDIIELQGKENFAENIIPNLDPSEFENFKILFNKLIRMSTKTYSPKTINIP